MKYLILTHDLSLPVDEGRKKIACHLIMELSKKEEVLAICTDGKRIPKGIRKIKTNKLLISRRLKKEISVFKPNLIIYIFDSATIYSFIRSAILKKYSKDANIVMMAPSGPVNYKKYHKILLRVFSSYFSSDIILALSPSLCDKLERYKFNVRLVHSGVDSKRFKPVNHKAKLVLKEKYDIGKDNFIVLHVGHITKSRDLEIFNKIQKIKRVQVLIVGSETVPKDNDILKALKDSGVKLITNHIDNIEEIYQLSDCYVFPVRPPTGAVAMPLSVLEAMACNLPVITTIFEILPILFKEGNGLFYYTSNKEIIDKVIQTKTLQEINTKALIEQYSWEKLAGLLNTIAKNCQDPLSHSSFITDKMNE